MVYCHAKHVESNKPHPPEGTSQSSGINWKQDRDVRAARPVLFLREEVESNYTLIHDYFKLRFLLSKTIAISTSAV